MFGSIAVNPYRMPLGRTSETHSSWAMHIQGNLQRLLPNAQDISVVDVYNMTGTKEDFSAGGTQRFVIFGNVCHTNATETHGDNLPHRTNTLHIKNSAGEVIAEFDKNKNELFILFDVFTSECNYSEFDHIMQQLDSLYYLPLTFENSWVHTSDKNRLTETLTQTMRSQRESFIEDEKHKIDRWKNEVNSFRSRMKEALDKIQRSSTVVMVEEQQLSAVGQGLLKDLDLIVHHEKVKDLHIKDNKFIVYTNPLYMYTSKDERFYLGNMRIELDPSRSDVRFFGDNPRRSYWTPNDPHPHVNGSNGEACLGNASALIAELSHQMQLYPLVLTAIDFLEQANIEDPAGRKVYNWDQVDDEGHVIRTGGEARFKYCYHCEEEIDPRHIHIVYGYIDEDGPTDQREVCGDCRENYYAWDEDAEVYIND